jgi:hypothetical protein
MMPNADLEIVLCFFAVFSAVSGLELSMEKGHHKCKNPIKAMTLFLLLIFFRGVQNLLPLSC